ncbi:hypothetical protein [Microbulbifer thermotolerans]|uniref:hypothetical protein n=1 Tax=Microbulbifer thermotolerans TaxID=252514 RepID=UPI00224981B8|nr:hypothetical protein [Microbulbifer thermotolerans]MCX2833140.1 hypothetical protein [Microbulbifer thermotolerans]
MKNNIAGLCEGLLRHNKTVWRNSTQDVGSTCPYSRLWQQQTEYAADFPTIFPLVDIQFPSNFQFGFCYMTFLKLPWFLLFQSHGVTPITTPKKNVCACNGILELITFKEYREKELMPTLLTIIINTNNKPKLRYFRSKNTLKKSNKPNNDQYTFIHFGAN